MGSVWQTNSIIILSKGRFKVRIYTVRSESGHRSVCLQFRSLAAQFGAILLDVKMKGARTCKASTQNELMLVLKTSSTCQTYPNILYDSNFKLF